MPWRLQPVSEQRQCEGNLIGVIFCERIQQRRNLGDLFVLEFSELGGQGLVEFCQCVAGAQYARAF